VREQVRDEGWCVMCVVSPPPNQQPAVSGGLPASPPADIVRSAQQAIREDYDRSDADTMGLVAHALIAIWPDIVALVAVRDTDETTLRTRIAEQIEALPRSFNNEANDYGLGWADGAAQTIKRAAHIAKGER
jgi:hypothetical protein